MYKFIVEYVIEASNGYISIIKKAEIYARTLNECKRKLEEIIIDEVDNKDIFLKIREYEIVEVVEK